MDYCHRTLFLGEQDWHNVEVATDNRRDCNDRDQEKIRISWQHRGSEWKGICWDEVKPSLAQEGPDERFLFEVLASDDYGAMHPSVIGTDVTVRAVNVE